MKHIWFGLLWLIGCHAKDGAILLVADVGSDAAVLRYHDHQGTGQRDLLRLRRDGEQRWVSPVGLGPGAAGSWDVGASPWLVLTEPAGPPSVQALDAETGQLRWTWMAPTKTHLVMNANESTVILGWDKTFVGLDRLTGIERWRRELEMDVHEAQYAMVLGGVAIGTLEKLLFLGEDGTVLLQRPIAGAWCATQQGLVWLDPEGQNWRWKQGEQPQVLAIQGRIRRGCGTYQALLVVPFHNLTGEAAIAAFGDEAEARWQLRLGIGSHIDLNGPTLWPRFVPFLLEVPGGRQLSILDLAEAKVHLQGSPRQTLTRVQRLGLSPGLGLLTEQQLLGVSAETGEPYGVLLPGVEGQAPAARLGTIEAQGRSGMTGAWVLIEESPKFLLIENDIPVSRQKILNLYGI